MSKHIILLILLILSTAVYVDQTILANSTPVTITDALGRIVNITYIPSRVVSLSPSITEILLSLGLNNSIIGVDSISYNDWYLNASAVFKQNNVTDVGGYWWSAISIEKIISLKPDLVLADAGAHKPLLKTFEEYNLTVVYLKGGSATSVEDIYSDIYTVGVIFNKVNDATALINSIEKAIDSGRMLLEKYAGTRILYVVGIYQGIWVAGRSTFFNDLISRLGLTNAAQVYGWASVGLEEIISWKPSVILVASMGILQSDIEKAGLDKVGAKIVLLNNTETDILSRPSPIISYSPEVLSNILANVIGISSTTQTPQVVTHTITSTITETRTETSTITVEALPWYSNIITTVSALISLIVGIVAGWFIRSRR
ncbi:ABC transporter substrate-binding protein [Thermogladius sp. 4427co]|uniref:ABC transporter substrate-binding protein n=1 Tax=Thermogladius sp. 4427co TaxID=3450718 RepID=UPI003F7AA2F9